MRNIGWKASIAIVTLLVTVPGVGADGEEEKCQWNGDPVAFATCLASDQQPPGECWGVNTATFGGQLSMTLPAGANDFGVKVSTAPTTGVWGGFALTSGTDGEGWTYAFAGHVNVPCGIDPGAVRPCDEVPASARATIGTVLDAAEHSGYWNEQLQAAREIYDANCS